MREQLEAADCLDQKQPRLAATQGYTPSAHATNSASATIIRILRS